MVRLELAMQRVSLHIVRVAGLVEFGRGYGELTARLKKSAVRIKMSFVSMDDG